MTQKELARYEIIKNLLNGIINGTEASMQTGLSLRHIRRIKKRVRILGASGIIHSARGKPGNRRVDEVTIRKAISLIKEHYHDFGPTLTQEKLDERDGIKLSVTAVKKIMVDSEIWVVKAKKPIKYRRRRKRKEYPGEMVQFDGSYHDWFENNKEHCLLAGKDDATGYVTARFAPHEGVIPVLGFWKMYVKKHGKPLSVYLDRYSTYKVNIKSAKENLTQFERVMEKTLDIEVIHARSAQAKGRIENLFGTFQDRLIKEMRLEGIKDPTSGNRFLEEVFLPKYNAKFNVTPAKKKDMHRKLNSREKSNLNSIFSRQNFRRLNNDFTVRHKNCWYQLKEDQPIALRPGDDVLVEERTNGKIYILKNDKFLNYELLPARPPKILEEIRNNQENRRRTGHPVPANHPWRGNWKIKTRTPEPLISYTY